MKIFIDLLPSSLVKLTSFLFWGTLYIGFAAKSQDKTPEWSSRAITLIHSVVGSLLAFYQCGLRNHSVQSFTESISLFSYSLMVWSWGYFAFDLYWCLIFSKETMIILVHHLISIIAITRYMQKANTGCTFACTYLLMEITNPLLQTRWFLRSEGYEKTLLFSVIEVAFIVLFFFFRGILGTWLTIKLLTSKTFDVETKIFGILLYGLSLFLMWDILKYTSRKYKTKADRITSVASRVYSTTTHTDN